MKKIISVIFFIIHLSVVNAQQIDATDTNKNLTVANSYDQEGNVIGASVAYFDEFGNLIQGQSKDLLTGKNWATETRYDDEGRPVLSTMAAPIGSSANFSYKTNFIRRSNGTAFTNSDIESNPELPSIVGATSGTLGWYYSVNNTGEPYQDITDRPYNRSIYDELNPGKVRAVVGGNSAQVTGNSGLQYNFPQGYTHTMPATQELYYAFGKEYFNEYYPQDNAEEIDQSTETLINGIITSNDTHLISHRVTKAVTIDVHGNENIVFTDLEGKVLAAARSGGAIKYTVASYIGAQGYVDVHLPKGTTSHDITFFGTTPYEIWDLRKGEIVAQSSMTGGNIYRIVDTPQPFDHSILYINTSNIPVSVAPSAEWRGIQYKVNYYDYALNYYDDAGNLTESVQPLGFDNSGLSSLNTTPQHTMISSYDYDALGQLKYTNSPDEGGANFVYRKDGQIRFSVNSKQLQNGNFSYTNYDQYARPIESGVCSSEYPGVISGPLPLNLVASYPNNLVISGNSMNKVSNGWSTGSFHSENYYTGDFKISWTVQANNPYQNVMMGFSLDPSALGYGSINYAMYCYNNFLRPYKNGSYQSGNITRFEEGDIMSLSRVGERIGYYKNGILIYQLEISPEHIGVPMAIDGTIFRAGTTVSDIVVEQILGTETISNTGDDFEIDPAFCSEQTFTLYDVADQSGLDTVMGTMLLRNQEFLAGNVSKTWTENPETSATWYSYDIYSRVSWMVQFINGLGTKVIDYTYDDLTGEVVKVRYTGDQNEDFSHRYTYNQVGQLTKVETSYDNANYKEQASYSYYEPGALKRTNIAEGVQGTDYVYNINGALKSINHPSLDPTKDPGGDANDVFGMIIDYHKKDYNRTVNGGILTSISGSNRYDGNIKATRWAIEGSSGAGEVTQSAYTYTYNQNNWLQEAEFGTASSSGSISLNSNNDYKVSIPSYDANGNILALSRNKNTINPTTSNSMDGLAYHYAPNTNQLNYVSDGALPSSDTGDIDSQNPNNYTYNEIGQLTHNAQDNIEYTYTTSGLVSNVVSTNSDEGVSFTYNDRGHRIKKHLLGTTIPSETYYVRDVSGQPIAIYNDNTSAQIEYPIYGASRLGISKNGDDLYELTDHLGNVRAVVQEPSGLPPQDIILFNDTFENGNITPWQQLHNPLTESSGFLNVTFSRNYLLDETKVDIVPTLQAGEQYRLSYFAKIDASDDIYVGVRKTGTGIEYGQTVADGTHVFLFTPSQSGQYELFMKKSGVQSVGTFSARIDNVLLEKIAPIDGDGLLQAYRDYYPFGMPMPNRNLEGDYRYAYQGQEKDPETGKEAFELRLWDSRIGRWLTTDPYGVHHSPYIGMANDPLNTIDPDGGAPWKPIVNDDGSTSYLAEDGDTVQTFADQFGVSLDEAQSLIGTNNILSGFTEVSGQSVFNMFGTEVLTLDLTSNMATDQRVVDQFIYAIQHSKSKGAFAWSANQYFGNIYKTSLQESNYTGKLCCNAQTIDVSLDLQWYRTTGGAFFNVKAITSAFGNDIFGVNSTSGTQFGNLQRITHSKIEYGAIYNNEVKFNGYITLFTQSQNSHNLNQYVFKQLPNYNYINTNGIKY